MPGGRPRGPGECVRWWQIVDGPVPIESDGMCQETLLATPAADEPVDHGFTRNLFLENPSNRVDCIAVPEDPLKLVYLVAGGVSILCLVVLVITVGLYQKRDQLQCFLLTCCGWRYRHYSIMN